MTYKTHKIYKIYKTYSITPDRSCSKQKIEQKKRMPGEDILYKVEGKSYFRDSTKARSCSFSGLSSSSLPK